MVFEEGLVIDDTRARYLLLLVMIQRVCPGKNGNIRVVDVKMKNGTFR